MSFVKLDNLNDFIQPGSTCIKPSVEKKIGVVAKVGDINLSDCLACSGCITSAETVLVQQQNHEELFRVINESKSNKDKKTIVVSLSLQSISSLANKYSITAQDAAERIASFFISIGCDKVYEITLARHLALIESYKELTRCRQSGSNMPLISSVCPGWVCYIEKTNGESVIPHLSKVRSPQQIMGSLLKRLYEVKKGESRDKVYHVTLMPCFDKKLEASREDFKNSDDKSQDVDCVLTPLELEEILNEEGVTLMDFEARKLDVLFDATYEFSEPLTSHIGSGSGGYAENLLLADCGRDRMDPAEVSENISYSITKNSDFLDINLKDSQKAGRFAIVNGFRNIQTVVQRLKRKALKYDYIEVMACPSGCLNGGAQCKPGYNQDQQTTVKSVGKIYNEVKKIPVTLDNSQTLVDKLIQELGLENEQQFGDLLTTQFHAVPKMQNLTVSW